MWGVIPFAIGLVGLALFGILRIVETRNNRRVFDAVRSRLDAVATRLYRLAVFGEVPATYRVSFKKALHHLVHRTVVLLVKGLRTAEQPLVRLSSRLRRSRRDGTDTLGPSPFIKRMSEANKKRGEVPPDSIESN